MKHDYRALARAAARVASDKKASLIEVFDLREASDIADYMIVVGAESMSQMQAIEYAVTDQLRTFGVKPLHIDGRHGSRWLALDYGGLVMHILLPEAREFYRLDHLWENPHRVAWQERATPAATKKKKKVKK